MAEPVPVRDAATVLLLRDASAPDGRRRPEAWLLTRVTKMAFAAGMTVFPGGRVDAADSALPWAGRPAAEFAADFGCSVELAHALVGCAVRETFEEAGVLLTTPSPRLAHAQPEVEAGRISFAHLLDEHRLAVDADLLRPWARWITPPNERMARRFDTRFFVAALPAGADATDLTTESSIAGWVSPLDALTAYENGERMMLPPTIAVLRSVCQYSTVADVLAAATGRSLEPVRPEFQIDDRGRWSTILPDGFVLRLRQPL